MQTIPLTQIKISPDRQRKNFVDIDKLAKSLARFGLLHPVVLDADNTLIAGERRLRAAQSLGWTNIPFNRRDQLTDIEKQELELEENVNRQDLSWQERVCAVARIHNMKRTSATLTGEEWTLEQTGALVGMAMCRVWYAVEVAKLLNKNDEEVKKALCLTDAIKILVSRREKEAAALLSKQVTSRPAPLATASVLDDLDLLDELSANEDEVSVPPPSDLDKWIQRRCFFCDSMNFMASMTDASVDHIYTDPPYAIDMHNLDQNGSGQDTSRVEAEHEVKPNKELLAEFIGRSYHVLKETGFLVMWCDQDVWDYLKQRAIEVGFQVQRWPLIWCKTDTCKNQMAYHNFTKSTEIAMLCRMPKARLITTRGMNYWTGPNDKDEYKTLHPFWKPIALHRWILSAIALPGSTILDPFAGEGSIPTACCKSGYDFIAIEKVDIHYAQLTENILNTMTPK